MGIEKTNDVERRQNAHQGGCTDGISVEAVAKTLNAALTKISEHDAQLNDIEERLGVVMEHFERLCRVYEGIIR